MLYEALVEEIKRKAFIAKSMGQEFTDENYLEEIEKAMGRRAVKGEVRTWRGKEYIKTPKGWRPKPKGYKEGAKSEVENKDKEHVGSEGGSSTGSRTAESITDEFSEIFFNRKTTPGKITAFVDKYLGEGATKRIWDGLDKMTFDSSTDKSNAFIEKFYDLLSDKMWNEKKHQKSGK